MVIPVIYPASFGKSETFDGIAARAVSSFISYVAPPRN